MENNKEENFEDLEIKMALSGHVEIIPSDN